MAARDAEAVRQACAQCAAQLECEYFIYGAYIPVVESIVIVNGFPTLWRERYVEAGYINSDPTVRHCSQNTTPVWWHGIPAPKKGRQAAAEQQVMDEAADNGLRFGISVPMHGAGAEWGMLSLASSRELEPHGPACMYGVQFLTQSAHEAVKRINAEQIDAEIEHRRLTDRERECLQWTANGKTAWEISRILSLSESTVTFHLKNAIQKMDVTNRPHAVAKALAQSRITLF